MESVLLDQGQYQNKEGFFVTNLSQTAVQDLLINTYLNIFALH